MFLHCPRSFMRSRLWDGDRTVEAAELPSMARMLWDQRPTKPAFPSAEEYERDQARRLRELY